MEISRAIFDPMNKMYTRPAVGDILDSVSAIQLGTYRTGPVGGLARYADTRTTQILMYNLAVVY